MNRTFESTITMVHITGHKCSVMGGPSVCSLAFLYPYCRKWAVNALKLPSCHDGKFVYNISYAKETPESSMYQDMAKVVIALRRELGKENG